MRIIKPSVTYVPQYNIYDHIARAAKICYATEEVNDTKKFVEKLIKAGHVSMLRHGTIYFIRPNEEWDFIEKYKANNFSSVNEDSSMSFITTNMQVIHDNGWYADLERAENYPFVPKNCQTTYPLYPAGFNNMRYTFEVITQISTSRELNRTSPNNIAEQSTRYCNFAKNKFGNEITICQPHWFDIDPNRFKEEAHYKWEDNVHWIKLDDDVWKPMIDEDFVINKDGYRNYSLNNILWGWYKANEVYMGLTADGMLAQDAREMLPLATATKCAYTYTINEWRNIIDLRYYGTTGAPHPNAKIIAGMIREELIKLGHEFR